MDSLSDFDLGPLTWVKAEIDVALNAGVKALTEWNGADTTPLKEAATYLHQVSGALQIVDLQGVYQVSDCIEGLLADMQAKDALRNLDSADLAIEAIRAVQAHLDRLMATGQPGDLGLMPVYTAMQIRRGAEPPPPSELFYPDLGARARRAEPEPELPAEALGHALRLARVKYQKGLLHYLQQKDADQALDQMAVALREVERLAPGTAQYTFWWAASGLLEAIRRGGVAPDWWARRMFARLDLQLRRLMDGSKQLADRLFRDVLFYLSQDVAPSGRAAEARALFELERFAPAGRGAEADARVLELSPRLAHLREVLATAKEQWLRLCSGRRESLDAFHAAARQLAEVAESVADPALDVLAKAVREAAMDTSDAAQAVQNEALQVEMATALLLFQHGAENFFQLGHDFADHAGIQAKRLRAALAGGDALAEMPAEPLLDEIARQAQEKLLLAQVTREIQINLHQIEEILDKFFRDRRERGGLPLVPGLLKQVQGALNMLQLDVAVDLVRAAGERIGLISEADHDIVADELNWIAEAISTLGLYVEALRNGRDDPTSLNRLLHPPEAAEHAEASVEDGLAESAEKLLHSAGQLAEVEDQVALRDEMQRELSRLAEDADLVGDRDLRSQADEALRLLEQNATAEDIQSAVQHLAGAPAPVEPAPPPPTANEREVDAELLEIYIEEAKTVLGDIFERLGRLHRPAHEHADFVDIRRGFHTLKGSGRMVGLTDLAEVAWEAEQTLNLWLREERAINSAILDFVEQAGHAFQSWVHELEQNGHVVPEAEAIVARARRLRGEADAVTTDMALPAAEVAGTVAALAEGPLVGTDALPDMPEAAEAMPEPQPMAFEAPVPDLVASPEPSSEEAVVMIGEHPVPAPLFAIFSDEAAHRMTEMREHLAEMGEVSDENQWEGFSRTAHTLAGISRATGLSPLAEAAHAVELWAAAWPDKTTPLTDPVLAGLSEIVEALGAGFAAAGRQQWPEFDAGFAARLEALRPPAPMPEATPEGTAEPPLEETPALAQVTEAPAMPEAVRAPEAAPVPEAMPAPEMPEETCDPQLLPIFLAEADELLPRIGDSLRRWRAEPDSPEPCQALQRALHTLKGSARMAGAMRLGDDTHAMESRLAEWGEAAPEPAFLDSLEHEYDTLAEAIDRLRHPGRARHVAPTVDLPAVAAALPEAPVPEDDAGIRQAFKAKASILDALINEAGEISIARSRIEAAINGYKQTALELTANVERLRGQLRELEIEAEKQIGARMTRVDASHFDPLEFDRYTRLQELTRLMAESVNDVSTAQENLSAGLSDAEYALLQQSRTTRSLQQELMRIRMVRLNSQSERLHRIVRQAAKELGRKARLHVEGGETELDRTVLDKALVPFEHLLRNAVAHGVETAEQRLSAGKPEYGEIRLSARQEGTEVVLTLSDDGAGIDHDRVRARAEAMGWLKPGEPVERERLESFLFMPGFSTVETVTQVAGRGVGLDVVRSEIAAVGGRIRVESEAGQGTRFTIRLPATLALAQVVLASAGDQVYAIPANMVVLVREMKDEEWHALVAAGQVDLDGVPYPLRSLAELTGQPPQPVEGRFRTVLLLRSGDERVALRVDELRGNAEAVVKAIGPQLSRVPGVAGATVLSDGRVALILNPFALMESAPAAAAPVVETPATEDRAPLVLVVDDSLTVRKITSRLLQREGYRVATAKDGVEALEYLQEDMPAVMLLDIEMPRMDGFEVARHVRADSRTRPLPIIMITSRTADKHREHALDLGVDLYMGKPYREDELLGAIADFVKMSSR
ncbi:MAG: Hpt domain-containing protein [Pseudomonadota bacterium]